MSDLGHIQHLYRKYIDDRISETEQTELFRFFCEASDADIGKVIDSYLLEPHQLPDLGHLGAVTGRVFQKVSAVTNPAAAVNRASPPRPLWKPLVAASAIFILLTLGVWLYWNKQPQGIGAEAAGIVAGTHNATLTLANGQTIPLSKTQTGIVIHDQDITYTDGTSIGPASTETAMQELVLTTPKGSAYQVTLPDSSRVWLNADSRLTYPTRFSETGRVVNLVGEAFFDIRSISAPDSRTQAKVPFQVITQGQTVEVLGTQFNINAYANEPATTTSLLEGKVRIIPKNGDEAVELSPGQQARMVGHEVQIGTPDISALISWTQNVFVFQNTDLATIIRQLERWYDVRYEGGPLPEVRYYGVISREANLLQVLEYLEMVGNVRFHVKERRMMLRQ